MILSVQELKDYGEFDGFTDKVLQRKLDAMENFIRNYTNNNFQKRTVRFTASSSIRELNIVSPLITVGDTIQISNSINEGLYVVEGISTFSIQVDKKMIPTDYNLVTKVEYPPDVQDGVVDLMKWEVQQKDKIGIKSETISRVSVTYFEQDKNNQVNGYPVSLLGFLEPYMKARFV